MKTLQSLRLAGNLLLLILLFPIVQVIFKQMGVVIFGPEVFTAHPWLHTIFSHTIILVLLMFYLIATFEPLKNWGFFFEKKYLWLSAGIGAFSAVVLYLIDSSENFFELYAVPSDPSFLVALGFMLSWAVIGPLTEEILFRGIIQTTLIKKLKSEWTAIVLTVALEVVMHSGLLSGAFSGWAMLGYVGVFSLAASWIYSKTRSLTGPLLIHALGNAGELVIFWLV